MTTVLVDTSGLINLAIGSLESEIPHGDVAHFIEKHDNIVDGIDALVLSEAIAYDRPSLKRALNRIPEIAAFAEFGSAISSLPESDVYTKMAMAYLPVIEGESELRDLGRWKYDTDSLLELGTVGLHPSATWADVARALTSPAARSFAVQLAERLEYRTPEYQVGFALLLRTLYYDCLQNMYGTDLVLSGNKQTFRDHPSPWGSSVLKAFDNTTRDAFRQRKREWLGDEGLTVDLPLLTSYVLGQSKSWRDLPKVLADVRQSREATRFREGMSELRGLLSKKDNVGVDAILNELSSRRTEWNKRLGSGQLTRKMTFSVPLLGLGTEFLIRDRKLGREAPADKILGFVQVLLAGV